MLPSETSRTYLFEYHFLEIKSQMVDAMKVTFSEEEPNVRVSLDLKLVQEKSLPDFVTSNTMKLFSALDITTEFFETPPSSWHTQSDVLKASDRIKSLSVTNDHAECGVALVHGFSGQLTHDEQQLQFCSSCG